MEDQTIQLTRPQSAIQQPVIAELSKSDNKYPTETIDLPSEGRFYSKNNPLSTGQVELKMMTAKEEDILTNQNLIKKGQVLDKLIDSLIVNKNINTDDLLIGDKNAIFFATRRLAYGDDYGPLQIKCPSCKESNEITVNLSELKYKQIYDVEFEPHKV